MKYLAMPGLFTLLNTFTISTQFFNIKFIYLHLLFILFTVCGSTCMCMPRHTCGSQRITRVSPSIVKFLGIELTHVTRLSSKHLHSLSHLAGPLDFFDNLYIEIP